MNPDTPISFSISIDDSPEALDRAIRVASRNYAENEMKRLNALGAEFGLNVNAIIREQNEGDWDTPRAAAEYLASDTRWFVRLWNWIERMLGGRA